MKSGIELIHEERNRQITVEGWKSAHDAKHTNKELASAAACYATRDSQRIYNANMVPIGWPWEKEWWKPTPNNRIKEIVKAGALYLAEDHRTGKEEYTQLIYSLANVIDELQLQEDIDVKQYELVIELQTEIMEVVKRHEKDNGIYHSARLPVKITEIIEHYKGIARSANVEVKDFIDNALSYFRAINLYAESVAIASTHGEKNARLRGLADLLNNVIEKLKNHKTDNILNHVNLYSWDLNSYPYRAALDKYNDLVRENANLKGQLQKEKPVNEKDDLPF